MLGENCPKCKMPMDRRRHGSGETKHLAKKYYYSEWDVCTRCKHIQHYERFKVFPTAPIAPFVKSAWDL
jgi:hypothetical protein